MTCPESLADLSTLALTFRNERNWAKFNSPKNMAVSLLLEAAELLELVQWAEGESSSQQLKMKKTEAAEELSDILYWVLLIASELELDLAHSFKSKLQINAAKYPVDRFFGVSRKYNEG